MSESVSGFYDALSPFYHDNMGWDWDAAMREEGAILGRFLSARMGDGEPRNLLDCACGIGTQAIGLALQGHRVHATDLSAVSVDCARREASRIGVDMTFGVADFRDLGASVADTFDVVVACDNSIAHCLSDGDLATAVASMKSRLVPGGVLLLSIRDYAALVEARPRFNNQHAQDRPDGRRVVFQLWDWADDGHSYVMHQYLIRQDGNGTHTHHFETKLRALLRDELIAALRQAGYADIRWRLPEESGYYQPIVTALNA
ncbi:MAG: class I SAM-dependent methyltransferase [Gammaproteobacteria bacterium]|nr:class I SAM-dependent methyltransferase [Gammaproteobacteria bacterium]